MKNHSPTFPVLGAIPSEMTGGNRAQGGVYYNEFDPKAAGWLRELQKEGHIPEGWVDERSIKDVKPHELTSYTHRHFFAGIGGWAYALRLAGWPDSQPVDTASCPCQPFSAAGKGLGTEDERHLWPVFRDVITFGRASVTFGEQVASKAGREWLAGIRADLEGLGYAVGAADLCAAGVGSPHIRQRLYWMADPGHQPAGRSTAPGQEKGRRSLGHAPRCGVAGGMEYPESDRREQRWAESRRGSLTSGCSDVLVGMGDADSAGSFTRKSPSSIDGHRSPAQSDGGAWDSFDILPCTDGKARRVESGTFPLAHGVSGRVGLLRGYGNAIVPQVAAEFIKAFLETQL